MKADEWIDVNDRLPENPGSYQVFFANDIYHYGYADFDDGFYAVKNQRGETINPDWITHWRSLSLPLALT